MDNKEELYVILWKIPQNTSVGALHDIKLAYSSIVVLL